MKKILISGFLILVTVAIKSQQLPQVSHFMYDNVRTNPGSAGNKDMICISGISRQQMVGFPGNPVNFIFNVDAPFRLFGVQHGVGLAMFNDALGFNSDINFQLDYAFRVNIGDGVLGIGVSGGFFDKNLDPEWVYVDEDTDPYAPEGDATNMAFSLGAGLFYRNENIYFGASALNINTPEIVSAGSGGNTNSEVVYLLERHYYITAGYDMQLSNPAWELKPAVLLKSDFAATDLDLNLTVEYNKNIWGGVTYRTGEAVIGMIGLELIENLRVGYSYDFATSSITKYSSGSHEIMLNYCFKIGVEKAPQKYKSIRFL
ncbi:MAG: type IX secretion system membrane protein PorP/SprF [Bacteroidales bacterium]|nr:type IX secretion system membrane protein PorP/SprF [Bacteroidales bacterium]